MVARTLRLLLWLPLLAACSATEAGEADGGETGSATATVLLTDGTWALRVDRAWDGTSGSPGLPSDELQESDYDPVDDGPVYAVVVSESGAAVAVGDGPMRGARTSAGAERSTYELGDGTFAGGRIVAWANAAGLEAELTIYGSGRPIVASERGDLVRVH